MKAIVLCFLGVAAVALARPGSDTYTDKYDNVDLDEVLKNRRLFVPYANCLLEKGKCAPDAKELKEHVREALENQCGKCNDAQKKGTRQVIEHLINNEADIWTELTAKYDPDHKYTKKYEDELKKIKA